MPHCQEDNALSNIATPSKHVPSRRLNPRLKLHREISVRLPNDAREFKLVAADLSFSGAFLETKAPLAVGDELLLGLTAEFSADAVVNCTARVVHRQPRGVGVVFVNPTDDFLDALYTLIYRHVRTHRDTDHDDHDLVPGRILLLRYPEPDSAAGSAPAMATPELLFTSHLSPNGVWALSHRAAALAKLKQFYVALAECGLFDCQVSVCWEAKSVIGLRFVDPSPEFSAAYQRLLSGFQD